VLLDRATAEGIADGSVTLAFRRWDRPRMRPSSRQRTVAGGLEVVSVEEVDPATLTEDDTARADGPWTSDYLRLIAANPGVRAPDLAAGLGRETLPFKRDVRKLKELGLTHSLAVGYQLSARGRAYLG
jgi:hypothetical protein